MCTLLELAVPWFKASNKEEEEEEEEKRTTKTWSYTWLSLIGCSSFLPAVDHKT